MQPVIVWDGEMYEVEDVEGFCDRVKGELTFLQSVHDATFSAKLYSEDFNKFVMSIPDDLEEITVGLALLTGMLLDLVAFTALAEREAIIAEFYRSVSVPTFIAIGLLPEEARQA